MAMVVPVQAAAVRPWCTCLAGLLVVHRPRSRLLVGARPWVPRFRRDDRWDWVGLLIVSRVGAFAHIGVVRTVRSASVGSSPGVQGLARGRPASSLAIAGPWTGRSRRTGSAAAAAHSRSAPTTSSPAERRPTASRYRGQANWSVRLTSRTRCARLGIGRLQHPGSDHAEHRAAASSTADHRRPRTLSTRISSTPARATSGQRLAQAAGGSDR